MIAPKKGGQTNEYFRITKNKNKCNLYKIFK